VSAISPRGPGCRRTSTRASARRARIVPFGWGR